MADGSVLGPEQLLERFLFPRAMHDLRLSRLSGGELRRVQLVRLLADSPNFLLLDEPTNDLDIDTIELLEDFLSDFPGCVLAVSHDRAFLDGLADSLLVARRPGRRARVRRALRRLPRLRDAAAGGLPARKAEGRKPARGKAAARKPSGRRRAFSYAERKELDGLSTRYRPWKTRRRPWSYFFSSSLRMPRRWNDRSVATPSCRPRRGAHGPLGRARLARLASKNEGVPQ